MRRRTRDALAVCMIIALIAGGVAVYSMHESGKVKEEILLMAAKRNLAGLRDDLAVRSPNDHYPEVVLAARNNLGARIAQFVVRESRDILQEAAREETGEPSNIVDRPPRITAFRSAKPWRDPFSLS